MSVICSTYSGESVVVVILRSEARRRVVWETPSENLVDKTVTTQVVTIQSVTLPRINTAMDI